jgi:hypothetical protein
VTIAGTNLAQSLAGLSQAERTEVRDKQRAETRPKETRRAQDEYDAEVTRTEAPDAVRHLASNDQEDAHEDRRSSYTPSGGLAGEAGRRRIDVQG